MAACGAFEVAQQTAMTGFRSPWWSGMTEIEHASGARVLVGIDISKRRHEVLKSTMATRYTNSRAIGA
jgi:hypothetical protein